MSKKKTGTFAILRILKKYSDSEHVMSTKEITSRLMEEYGIELERRTLYNNLSVLEDFGYKIHHYQSGSLGYYLEERRFSEDEILETDSSLRLNPQVPEEMRRSVISAMMDDYSIYQSERIREKLQ